MTEIKASITEEIEEISVDKSSIIDCENEIIGPSFNLKRQLSESETLDKDEIIGPSFNLKRQLSESETLDKDEIIGPSFNLKRQLSESETLDKDEIIGPSFNLKRQLSESETLDKDEIIGPSFNLKRQLSESETLDKDEIIGPSFNLKRQLSESETLDKEIIGPSLAILNQHDVNASTSKKIRNSKKGCDLADIYLKYVPKAKCYQISYMHRSPLTHVVFSETGFLITASVDGVVKFWKKAKLTGLDFVKRFRAHLDSVLDVKMSHKGEYCATIGADKTVKIFDILNCDMINMIKLSFMPYCCCWIYANTDSTRYLAVSEAESKNIYIVNVFEKNSIVKVIDNLHDSPITNIIYNVRYETAVSFDNEGMIEYWTGEKHNYEFPSNVNWKNKTDTNIYELFVKKASPISASFSKNGEFFAVYSSDKQIRIFNFLRAKLITVIDESTQVYTETGLTKEIPSMELGRRLAVEKDLDRNEFKYNFNMEFDPSSNFLIYSSLLGIKVIDVRSQEIYRVLGSQENIRFLNVAISPSSSIITTDPNLFLSGNYDQETVEEKEIKMPLIVSTAFKRNRFYIFTNDEPLQSTDTDANTEIERDMLNEKPTKEEIISASESQIAIKRGASKAAENLAILHTNYGDIHLLLFPSLTPKTVENFVVHSKNGFYNGRIFHRVIKNFMIQTGCPFGNGSGGQSIWGGEFEDEFHPSLTQDKPHLVCMANTGEKGTNGSQFFITLKPCPWLENKHTIFGRVVKGVEVIQKINNVSTDKNDKPVEDIIITSVTVKHTL